MNLKHKRTFLLNGALLALLLFCSLSSVAAADNMTTENVNSTTVGNLTTGNVNSTADNYTIFERALCILPGFLLGGTAGGLEGSAQGVLLVYYLYNYATLSIGTAYYSGAIPAIWFPLVCGSAGAATGVAGAVAGAIAGYIVGGKAAEEVLANNCSEGHEGAVGIATGMFTGGLAGTIAGTIAGALAGALLGFCIGGPAGAIALAIAGAQVGAISGAISGTINGGLAGAYTAEKIIKKRATNN